MSNCYSQSELSKITKCSRANISKLTKKNPPILIAGPDGKIDIDDPTNYVWYETRMLKIDGTAAPQVPKKSAEKKKTAPKKQKPAINSEKTIESETDQSAPTAPEIPHHTTRKTEKTEDEAPKDESMAARKMRLEVEKLQEQRDNLRIKNQRERAQLVDRDPFVDAIFGYLAALNKNIMEMPVSYLDDVASSIEMKKSRPETASIITKAICAEIVKSKTQIEAELRRYTRELKTTSKKSEDDTE